MKKASWLPLLCLNIIFAASRVKAEEPVAQRLAQQQDPGLPVNSANGIDPAFDGRTLNEAQRVDKPLDQAKPKPRKAKPRRQRTVPVPPPPPPPIPVREADKSTEQREYETAMTKRLDGMAQEIVELNSRAENIDEERVNELLDTLRTAAGNRSVVRTKLKQLKFVPPAQWSTLKSGIEKAFLNLEESIQRARSQIEAM